VNRLPTPLPPRLAVPLTIVFVGAMLGGAAIGGVIAGFTFLPLFIGGFVTGLPTWFGCYAYVRHPYRKQLWRG
jgi:hypothetical protein